MYPSVSGCSYSIGTNNNSITVTIPSGKTFGYIYLDYVGYEPFYNYNTTIGGVEAEYIYTGRPIEPVPTVIYYGTVLTAGTYTVSYSNTTGPGSASVTVTGTGQYAGTVTRNYNIRAVALSDFNSLGNNTYAIATTTDLDHLAVYVNLGNNCQDLTFMQTADIAYSTAGLGDTDENFTTIGGYFGNSDKNFSGTFDGQGYTISGIRLYKTGDSNPSKNQGLFGRISGATIQNVTLTDARITGYRYVGGIVGNKASGTVQNCLVLESTITCENTYVGALFGKNNGTLANNYYHGCTVGGATTNIGTNDGDVTTDDGAVQVFSLILGEGITATPAPAVTYNNINYYTAGTEITLGAPQGYAITSATLTYGGSDYPIVGNSFEMPAQDVAVTAVLQARYTFDSTTGALTLNWGEFNRYNKWGSEVTGSAVTSVTATDEVSFTGDCYQLFYNFTSCTSMDLTDVNTANVSNMSTMFDGCRSLQSLNISGWNTANVTNMSNMFYGCRSLQSLNISGWNTANVSYMRNMFYGCSGLQSLDLSGWNTANVTDMKYMFHGCLGLQSLDLSGWSTAKVTDMYHMFSGCSGLQSLDLSGWSTAKVTNMQHMFYLCRSLQSLDLSGWNTAKVTNMSHMFYDCSGLQSLDLSDWSTANVTDMSNMFRNCSGLQSLDLSDWSTAKVTNMSNMFFNCTGLQSLNISGWNTANVTDMSNMFRSCTNLATIYVGGGWSTSRVGSSNFMFSFCFSLVGGMGTTYNFNYTNAEYARIDGGSDNPGYFTGRFTKEIAGYEDNESGWYLIASPLAADIAPTAVTNMTNETFDLYYFDQTGGTNGKEWKNWKNEGGDGYHFNLKTGKGYLYANSGNVTLMFTGTPYNGDGKVTLTKADGFEFSGWNLIGNPFSTAATLDKPFYRMNESGTALSAQVEAHNSVAAMEGVFVQASTNNETATFTQANNSKGGEKDAVPMLTLNLTRNRGEAIDNAIVRFDGGHTLEKFSFREGSTKIYIPQDGTDYAIATSNGQGEMPVNFKATENGTYTLTISTTLNSQLSTLNYLHLIDNMTGADVDLLTPEPVEGPATYTFTAKTTDYASRFKLVFSANGNADGDNDAFAFIDASGNIIVNGEGTLQVMDVMGRIIVSHGGHTRCVPTSGMQAGVYVLRLIDGENVRTQKIVIS